MRIYFKHNEETRLSDREANAANVWCVVVAVSLVLFVIVTSGH